MKVILHGRKDILDRLGGDTKIVLAINRYLKSKGIKCIINPSNDIDLSQYDIVHFFGIMRVQDMYSLFQKAKKLNKKIVVTPIYENLSYLDTFGRRGLQKIIFDNIPENLKEIAKSLVRSKNNLSNIHSAVSLIKRPFIKQQKDLLLKSQAILYSSVAEYNAIKNNFPIRKSSTYRVPYGIESAGFSNRASSIGEDPRKYILSVGRIEPKKNQLGVIEALKDIGIPIIFAGPKSQLHKNYVLKFLMEVKKHKHIKYQGKVSDKVLTRLYSKAKVHILASWFEVLGIVNLEAAVNGCNIVTTKHSYTRDYLKNYAWYCDPASPRSIRFAALKAFSSPTSSVLRSVIEKNYTWEKINPQILNIYKKLLE